MPERTWMREIAVKRGGRCGTNQKGPANQIAALYLAFGRAVGREAYEFKVADRNGESSHLRWPQLPWPDHAAVVGKKQDGAKRSSQAYFRKAFAVVGAIKYPAMRDYY